MLAEVGFHGMTMEGLAAAAGVGKATIYRRWATKEELLVDILDGASGDPLVVLPRFGSLREDLCTLLTALAEVLAGPAGVVSRAILGVVDSEPVLAEAFRRGPVVRWGQAFAVVFDRAVQRGEVEPGPGTSLAAEAGPAILIHRWLFTSQALEPSQVPAVVDEVMLPLLERRWRGTRESPGDQHHD